MNPVNRLLQKLAVPLLVAVGTALAQKPAPPLAFEVATVRPSAPLDPAALRAGTAHIGTRIDASRVDIGTAPLFRLICNAYRLRPYQVSGPEWLKNTNFDIQATIPAGATVDQIPEMLQSLLTERFGLTIHRENKEQSVYALVVGPDGPKLKESAPEPLPPPPAPDAPKPMEMSMPTLQGDVKLTRSAKGMNVEMPGGEITGKIRATPGPGQGAMQTMHLESSGTTMKTFAAMLSVGVVDKPVVDITHLTGAYEVAVDVTMDDAMKVARASVNFLPVGGNGDGNGGLADPSASAIMASIQKLGLKLEPRRLPIELLIVDHVEKVPSGN